MKLINTIEIEPLDFAKNDYKHPNTSQSENPQDWHNYWAKSISDSGLGKLKAVKEGSLFVDINQLKNDELWVILQHKIKDIDIDDYEETSIALIGGIAIRDDQNEIIIEPSCCGDLSDLSNWEDIFQSKENTWNQLWIGHPWIYFKREEEQVLFSDYYESNPNDLDQLPVKHTFDERKFRNQIPQMRKDQTNFEHKIATVLLENKIDHYQGIAAILSGSLDL